MNTDGLGVTLRFGVLVAEKKTATKSRKHKDSRK